MIVKPRFWKAMVGMLSLVLLTGLFSGCGAKDKPAVTTAAQLNDSAYTVGVAQGAASQTVAEQALPNAKIKYYTRDADAYLAVEQKKIDAFVYDRVTMEFAIASGLTEVKLLPDELGEPIQIAVGISPKSPIPDLETKINTFISQSREDGTLDDMFQRWVYEAADTIPDIPKPKNPTLTLKVATSGLVQPFSYYKGDQLCGYDIEFIYRFALWMNADVEISTYDYGGIYAPAEAGSIDCIIANLNVTEERKKAILFSDTIYESYSAVMVRDDGASAETAGTQGTGTATAYTDASQLNGKTLAVITGSIIDQTVSSVLPNASFSYFNSASDCVAALKSGKVEGFPVDAPMARLYVALNPDLTILPGELVESGIGMAFPKGSDLTAQFNREIARLRQSGLLDELTDKWMGVDNSVKTLPEITSTGEKGTLRVACVSTLEPMCYVGADGAPTGYDVELLLHIAQTLGKKVALIPVEFGGLTSMLESGKADLALGCLTISDERRKLVDMTDSYYDGGIVMVVRKGEGAAERRAPLENANFGVMTGSTAEVYLADTYPAAGISTFSAIADALTALSNGKVDYVMTAYTTSLNAVRLNPSLEIARKDVVMETSAIAVSKENPELLAQLDAVLAQLRADGTLAEIVSHWTREGQEYVREPRPVSDGKNGILRVAVSADREPMCFVMDGQYEGLDCELIEYMAYEMGMTVEYQNMQFSSLVAALVSGKADVVISNMTPTEERRESVSFTQSYFDNPQVLVARKSADAPAAEGEYTSLSQLSGKTVACITGAIFDQYTLKVVPDAKFVYYSGNSDELVALKSGKVEGISTDAPVAELFTAQNPELTTIPELVAEDHYGMILAKESPLTADFNREIAAMKEAGLLDEMFQKWIGDDESAKTMPDRNYPAPNGTIRVVCAASTEPMCYVGSDGVPIGFEVEMAVRVAEALGKKVELISVDFAGLIPMIQSGKADVAVGCLSISEERKQSLDMTDAYYDGGVVVVVRRAGVTAAEGGSFLDGLKQSFIRTFVTENRWKLVLDGLVVTVVLSVCSGLLGSVLGFGICMLRRSKKKIASIPAAVFIRIIQGTPIVVLLMILYYIIFGKLDISAILVAILGFAVNFGVYVSEMIRTGIDAVDKGQIEAAHALGFTRMRTFWKITFPQAARHFLPVFKGEFISMVKMTSVVGYIAIQDLTKVSDIIRSRTLEAFFPLIATAVLYFLVANILTILLSRLEISLDPKRRKRGVKGVVTK